MYQQIFKPVILLLVLAWFGLSSSVQALSPVPDGGYANANTAEGTDALFSVTTGVRNTADGYLALRFDTTGGLNTAVGSQALYSLASGVENTALGAEALKNNTDGGNNTAVGWRALFNNTGSGNIAVGPAAGFSLTTGHGNIDIGNPGSGAEIGVIRIGTGGVQGATFIAAGIAGVDESGTVATVTINSTGQLGTKAALVSSRRFKKDIKPMDRASEVILALKPVTFRYKEDRDPQGIPQFGLVAEDVEKVNPDLISRDKEGKPYTVRYDAVNAMLLNEFLKEHKAFLEEHRTVQHQQKEIDALKAELKEQAAQIQKVSAQLEVSKPAPQTVLNNP